jgi:glycosyltransferase involved in cell wall biosynthesis
MNRFLNILMVSPKPPSGAYARPHAMGKQLVRQGHQVTLVMVSEKERWRTEVYTWDGVRAVVTPHLITGRISYGWDPYDILRRLLFLNRDNEAYDLVHCFETRPSVIYPALWISHKQKLPVLTDWNDWFGRKGLVEFNRPWWYHLMRLEGIETYYEEAFRAKAAGLTVISSALGQRALALGVKPERICHIAGGAFLDRFVYRCQNECRLRMGFPLEIPILGFGSLDSHFDLEIVMAALAIVARAFPNIKLIVTGKVQKNVYQLTQAYRVEDHVTFVGYVPYEELPWYLGCADIFLLPMADKPYNVGRWPNKMGEYMSLGRPTVANPVGDIKNLFQEHQVGITASWDPVDFAEKVMVLLKDSAMASRLGENARKAAETEYDWSILAVKLENFYEKILKLEQTVLS